MLQHETHLKCIVFSTLQRFFQSLRISSHHLQFYKKIIQSFVVTTTRIGLYYAEEDHLLILHG